MSETCLGSRAFVMFRVKWSGAGSNMWLWIIALSIFLALLMTGSSQQLLAFALVLFAAWYVITVRRWTVIYTAKPKCVNCWTRDKTLPPALKGWNNISPDITLCGWLGSKHQLTSGTKWQRSQGSRSGTGKPLSQDQSAKVIGYDRC